MSEVASRIEQQRDVLSPAERHVADVVLRDPEAVAFGTVARVAARAGTSGASVVRLATRLGYPGYSGLQAAVQAAIGQQLRPAVERIRSERGSDVVSRTLRSELDNVERTLEAVTPEALDEATGLLADGRRAVRIVAGDAEAGVGAMLAASLTLLRQDVAQVTGSDVAVARQLATADGATVVVAIDLRRYERWVVDHVTRAVAAGGGGCGDVHRGGRGRGAVRQPRGQPGPRERPGHRRRRPDASHRRSPPRRRRGRMAGRRCAGRALK